MTEVVLLSGATGFIASHTIERLLKSDYEVVATCRDPYDHARLRHLKALDGADRLRLVQADLMTPNAFDDYAAEADYVLHMASPYRMKVKDPQTELVDPARHGTETMMQACAKSSRVKRVVITSSVAAITDEPPERVLNESDWNEKSSLTRNPYFFSKVVAERAAWEFHAAQTPSWDLLAINPFLVIGPAMNAALNESPKVFADMMNGVYPAIVRLAWGFVDVRDVADAHVKTLTAENANGRYLCCAETRTMREIVELLKANGFAGTRLPSLSLESAFGQKVTRLLAYTQPSGIRSYMQTHVGRVPRYDNSKIKNDLGIEFRSVDESIVETCNDLVKWGHIKKMKRAA